MVIAHHLFGYPAGGFVGVDIFFVISGYLITTSLLHRADNGRPLLWWFYRRRIRRIVPAATLVLVATCAAAYPILAPHAYGALLIDAASAFAFVSNWRFAQQGTDYFDAARAPSPVQHYWSLSVEEQFYLVLPALVAIAGVLAVRWARSPQTRSARTRTLLAGITLGPLVLASFGYAVVAGRSNSTGIYFSTFARVWEFGAGALVALTAAAWARLPARTAGPIIWSGLGAVVLGVVVAGRGGNFEEWALIWPVLGVALVIGAGIGRTPSSGYPLPLYPLTNRLSVYLGDISYSLYLWHFPIIVLLAHEIDRGPWFAAAALASMLGLSIATYHLVENPIRYSNWLEHRHDRRARTQHQRAGSFRPAILAAAVLVAVAAGLVALDRGSAPPPQPAAAASEELPFTIDGPAELQLSAQVDAALAATDWPNLNPSMDAAIAGPQAPADIGACSTMPVPPAAECNWGSAAAPKKIMIVGDSVAVTYVAPFRRIAEASGGRWQTRSVAAFGCTFVTQTVVGPNSGMAAECPAHKAQVVAEIKKARPDLVVITNSYRQAWNADTNRIMTGEDWAAGMQALTDQFAGSVGRIVFLAPPPLANDISRCFGKTATPAACVGTIDTHWTTMAVAERRLADRIGAAFVDSRPWFCNAAGRCPSFVGTTPVKRDQVHMTPGFAELITPAIEERFSTAGLIP